MKWFGEHWGAPVCDDGEHVETPVGAECKLCQDPIGEHDRGLVLVQYGPGPEYKVEFDLPVHHACLMNSVLGGET